MNIDNIKNLQGIPPVIFHIKNLQGIPLVSFYIKKLTRHSPCKFSYRFGLSGTTMTRQNQDVVPKPSKNTVQLFYGSRKQKSTFLYMLAFCKWNSRVHALHTALYRSQDVQLWDMGRTYTPHTAE